MVGPEGIEPSVTPTPRVYVADTPRPDNAREILFIRFRPFDYGLPLSDGLIKKESYLALSFFVRVFLH